MKIEVKNQQQEYEICFSFKTWIFWKRRHNLDYRLLLIVTCVGSMFLFFSVLLLLLRERDGVIFLVNKHHIREYLRCVFPSLLRVDPSSELFTPVLKNVCLEMYSGNKDFFYSVIKKSMVDSGRLNVMFTLGGRCLLAEGRISENLWLLWNGKMTG